MDVNYYEILGIEQNATQDEIHAAYRTLSKKYHPDVNDSQNAPAFFRMIKEAYEQLSNPETRAKYDSPQHKSSGGENFNEGYTNGFSSGEENFNGGYTNGFSSGEERIVWEFRAVRHRSTAFKLLTFFPILILRIICVPFLIFIGLLYCTAYIASHLGMILATGTFILGAFSVIIAFVDGIGDHYWNVLFGVFIAGGGLLVPLVTTAVTMGLGALVERFASYIFSPFWR